MSLVPILIDNKNLLNGANRTVLTATMASGSGTLTVRSINRFAINQILIIGEIGSEQSEIILTHASTAPTGFTITLASNTVYQHSIGTTVYIVNWNQYELSHATTTTGSKTTLTTTLGSGLVAIDPEQEFQIYNDTQFSTGYYFIRRKETIGGAFSDYTDAIPATGWAENSLGQAIDYALRRNKTNYTEDITHEDCMKFTNECLQIVQGKQRRWEENQSLNYVLGQTARGTRKHTLPTDIYDNDSNRSLIEVRIGTGKGLTWLDPARFEDKLADEASTQVTTQATAGQTTLEINNSYDFSDSGTVNVYISGTKYSITYTGVTRSATAGILTGVPASGTGAITVTIAVDTYVWQNELEGTPTHYTIRNGSLEYTPLPDSDNDNQNVYIDYWKVVTSVNSDGDSFEIPMFNMVKHYLTWAIRSQLRNDGKRDLNDADYLTYKEILNDAVRTKVNLYKRRMIPNINKVNYKYGRTLQ